MIRIQKYPRNNASSSPLLIPAVDLLFSLHTKRETAVDYSGDYTGDGDHQLLMS